MPASPGDFSDWLRNIRRRFHEAPELSLQEVETTRQVATLLREFGWQTTTFQDVTGVLGFWPGKEPGPTLALRADIDALPIRELNEAPYKSTRDGVMHACGHDAHTAILLGVARRISELGLMEQARGNLKLIFQPAEETLDGAKRMIAHHVLENPGVDRILALHVGPHLPAGTIGLYGEKSYASADTFEITVTGAGTHGARPDEGRDPIVASAYLITALQSIVSRNVKPVEAAVISIGKIHAGQAPNIIPETASLAGTLRTLDTDVRKKILGRLEEILEGFSTAFQVSCRFKLHEGTPVIRNDPDAAAAFRKASEKVFGRENIVEEPPTMGGEDFAFYMEKCPGAIVRLGCGNPGKGMTHPLHSPRFDLDETALDGGVALFLEIVRDFLGPKTQATP